MIVGVEVEARDLFVGDAVDRPAPDEAGEHLGEVARQAKRLPHLGDRAAGEVAGDDGGQRRAVPPIGLVSPLDAFFAPLMLEVYVDIGRLLALARAEPLAEKPVPDWVHRGDPTTETDAAVRRPPQPPA